MNEDSKQVVCTVAGYIVKTFSGRTNSTECKLKLIANEKFIEHDKYLDLLSRGGLTTSCPSLCDFNFQILSMLDFIPPVVMKKIKNVSIRNVSEKVLLNLNDMNVDFLC